MSEITRFEVVYICGCDPEMECKRTACQTDCFHTIKEEYAKNGACKDPWNHPERFEVSEVDDMVQYWERRGYRNESE